MRHISLPITMTPEQLADYIRSNRVDTVNHVEKINLTEDEKAKLAMESSLASRAIVRLEALLKEFTNFIKKGTPWDMNVGEDGDHRPWTSTIPPTKGIDKLKANRLFADDQIEKGYREEITPIYFIPWPEHEKMVAVSIEGEEWSVYSRQMSRDEVRQHGKPILSAAQELREGLAESGIIIDRVDGNTVHMSVDEKKRKKNRDLLADDDSDQPI
jgi:DNA-binding transcriptional ArsR family regulator